MVKREDLKKLESNDKRETWRFSCYGGGESACDSGEFATNPRRNLGDLAITAVSALASVGKALNFPGLRNVNSSTIALGSHFALKLLEDSRRRSAAQSAGDDGASN